MKHDCEYLICNKDDWHCSYENYRDTYWDPIMERLKMKHTPHDTRHTCISLLTQSGSTSYNNKENCWPQGRNEFN